MASCHQQKNVKNGNSLRDEKEVMQNINDEFVSCVQHKERR